MATSVIPGIYDFTIYQGATFRQLFIWKEDNVEVDVSGYTARMTIRATHADGVTPTADYDEILAELSTDDSSIVLGDVAGGIQLHLSAETTAALPVTPARYDLEMVETASGDVSRILMGKVTIDGEVTRG